MVSKFRIPEPTEDELKNYIDSLSKGNPTIVLSTKILKLPCGCVRDEHDDPFVFRFFKEEGEYVHAYKKDHNWFSCKGVQLTFKKPFVYKRERRYFFSDVI